VKKRSEEGQSASIGLVQIAAAGLDVTVAEIDIRFRNASEMGDRANRPGSVSTSE
jgi:hypothetical protein